MVAGESEVFLPGAGQEPQQEQRRACNVQRSIEIGSNPAFTQFAIAESPAII